MTKTTKSRSANLMKDKWTDDTIRWCEDDLQKAAVQKLMRLEDEYNFTFAAGLEGMKTTKSVAVRQKHMGMRAGEADLRLYFDGGRTVMVEMKRGTSGGQRAGTLSDAQKKRHPELKKLGFEIIVIKPDTPSQAQSEIEEIVLKYERKEDD